ncbi:hypothetical protein [Oceanobacter antarcticus]|uniref:Uncharacterized protein n=1 Tax=Oceanobacter antarcticus TaxID=3133425 RepID=A0ABW8NDC4_9GAMM
MILTEKIIRAYFEPMWSRSQRDYLVISQIKNLETFKFLGLYNDLKVKKITRSYRVGMIIKYRFLNPESPSPNIKLDFPIYSKIKLKKSKFANIKAGEIITENWAFNLGHCFREAVGLRLVERQKTKQWMQSPIFYFSTGSVFIDNSGLIAIQIEEATPCGFDKTKLDLGTARISVFSITSNGTMTRIARYSGNQFDFYLVLVLGIEYLKNLTSLGMDQI